jgi:glycosyltransferase involved in cell wall biosynthesis
MPAKSKRIVIIGNMNNNGFALMRYFRDLGADAYLLPYTNDGQESLAHFRPEADTWNIERWSPYILEPVLTNGVISALPTPFDRLLVSWTSVRGAAPSSPIRPLDKRRICDVLAGFDCLVGSGIAPAALQRIGRNLDIFFPYAAGVEYLEATEFTRMLKRGRISDPLFKAVQNAQREGIRSTRLTLNAETGDTESVLLRHGVKPVRLAIPMVYNREDCPEQPPSEALKLDLEQSGSELTILHHSRLMWSSCAPEDSKHNDWLFRGFAGMLAKIPQARARILVVEYGPDVQATKTLVDQLGLSGHVTWLPKMPRRDLTWLIQRSDMVFGECLVAPRTLWGGTGWEAFAYGSALMQGFLFEEGEFEALFDHPPPPMLGIKSMGDIEQHLVRAAENPESLQTIGAEAKVWFDQYNGISLANRWLELLTEERSLPAAQTGGQAA